MPREQIEMTKGEIAALNLMGASLGESLSDFQNLSLDELEAMLLKAYDAGYENAKEDVNKQIDYNAKWGLVDANKRYKKLSPEELENPPKA